MIKIGNVEFTEAEALDYVGKYLVTFRKVYTIEYSVNGGIHGREVYYHQGDLSLTKRGRYFVKEAGEVNRMIGYQIFKT